MKYGYFDDKNREYVIERPDTPAPWVNYLGSPELNMELSFPTMQEDTVSPNQALMEGSSGMYSIISISRDDTSISGITSQRITGLLPGSR